MHKNFKLKARTTDGSWYQFDIRDVPVLIGTDKAVLMGRPQSPIIDTSVILRGDRESGLFEGDVFISGGERWLVCYERGFYAINEQYLTKYLYNFDNIEYVGVSEFDLEFPIQYKRRKQHLFKCGEVQFFISQIVMVEDSNMVVRIKRLRFPREDIKQECCMSLEDTKLYLGDSINGSVVQLRGGRVCIETENGFLDLATGGILDGYIPKDVRRNRVS